MYKDSNLLHMPVVVFSLMTSHNTSRDKHNWIADNAFSSISSLYSSVIVVGLVILPARTFFKPFWVRTTSIWTRQIAKLILPSNFSISNFDIVEQQILVELSKKL